jgi:hypothetical protein
VSIEVVSVPVLLSRPRMIGGGWHYTHSHWTRRDEVALAAPTSIAHRASDTGLHVPPEWREAIYKYKSKLRRPKVAPLQYPYIAKVRGDHADLLAVNSLVPRGMPDYERADVCQEIMLAIWQKETSLEELHRDKSLLRKFTSGFRKANFEMNGYAISLDKPLRDGRSWYDILPDEPEYRL